LLDNQLKYLIHFDFFIGFANSQISKNSSKILDSYNFFMIRASHELQHEFELFFFSAIALLLFLEHVSTLLEAQAHPCSHLSEMLRVSGEILFMAAGRINGH
jgi:hypothetical protein